MPKVSPIQANFNGGEVSPLVYGRVDAPRYKESLAICQNYIPLIQGPVTRRPGSAFVLPVKDSSKVARLIPFEFSATQAYMLEFGNNYIRFFKNNAVVTNTLKVITGITQASPGVITSNGHGFSNGDHVVVASVSGMTELNNREYVVANITANTFTLTDNITSVAVNTTSYTAYSSGGTAAKIYELTSHIGQRQGLITAVTQNNPGQVTMANHGLSTNDVVKIDGVSGMVQLNGNQYTITKIDANNFTIGVDTTAYGAYAFRGIVYKINSTTYLTADIPTIKYTQSNDVMYLTHPSYKPRKLTRQADNSWTLQVINFVDGPYLNSNITSTTLTPGATGAIGTAQTYTASSIVGINSDTGFQSTDVGRKIRLLNADGTWGHVQITSVTSTTVVTVVVLKVTGGGAVAVSTWRLGTWSDTTGYPSCVIFHEDRLVLSGATGSPIRFDGSNSADYENMSPTGIGDFEFQANGNYSTNTCSATIAASNAYGFDLLASDQNPIQWSAQDEQGLILGTAAGEWLVFAPSSNAALSATNISAKKRTSYGSENVQAVQSGKCTIFVQKGGRKIRELNYYYDVNGFRAADLTTLAEHITTSRISYLAVQKNPQPIVWAVRNDGVLLSTTYEREFDVLKVGFARHIFGGSYSTGNAIVESVAVIPSADTESQDIYVIVKRTVNGQTVRYVEYLTQLFDEDTDLEDAFFVDAGLTYSGSSTLTISGLNHLIGQTVSVLADGGVQADRNVDSGGRIILDTPASVVTVGLSYNSDGQKLRSDAGAADGTAMGKTRRTHRVGILLLNTLGFKLGMDFTAMDDITLDDVTDANFDQAQGLYSGIATELITADYDFDNMICWRQSQPLPGTICGFYPQMVTQDRG